MSLNRAIRGSLGFGAVVSVIGTHCGWPYIALCSRKHELVPPASGMSLSRDKVPAPTRS